MKLLLLATCFALARALDVTECSFDHEDCDSNCYPTGFKVGDDGCPSCECLAEGEDNELFEGDIVLTQDVLDVYDNNTAERGAYKYESRLWKNYWNDNGYYEIPYTYQHWSQNMQNSVDNAAKLYAANTCLRLVKRNGHKNYVYIENNNNKGCWSWIGKQGGGQLLSLSSGCWYTNTAFHEFMHAIGFFHEQSRNDRDGFVNIWWDNISNGQSYNFNKRGGDIYSLGSGYDLNSVMHYSSKTFSWNGRATITKKNGDWIGNNAPSSSDYWQINKLYGCS